MYVISYDISSDSLRAKIAKELENYGLRIQYSVFECKIDRTRFRELYRKLCQLTEGMEEGSIRVYEICENCTRKIQTIGVPVCNSKYNREDVIVL